MKLSLTVIASETDGLPVGTTRAFEGRDAVIGRGAGCDWILPDPANHLSKRHCVISFEDAACVIADTSTNGVYVNESPQPVGKGNRQTLADGDRLGIGDYVLEVRLVAARPRAAPAVPIDEDDPFGVAEYRFDPGAGRLGEPTPPAAHGGERQESGFLDGALFGHDGFAAPREGEWRGPPMPDNLAAERAAFTPPRVEGEPIPDDWFKDGVAPAPPPAATPSGTPLAAFLAGAGLSADALAGQDPAEVMRALGRAYREAVLGVAAILRTRAMVKSEFRIEQTMIGAVANNPLKFLSEPDAILAAMVGRPPPGFKDAAAALREGLRDLKAHELAMLAAMQVALMKLLAQLDPAALAGRLDRRSLLDAVLPAGRKARYWEIFEQSYKAIAGELADDFHGAFGKAFAAAYEDEMRRR